ncbi:unnamed protein product [Blumeria hordei]|uniref:non-specific serine/threonine protein kinase n=1 Tax=Blumeria hordei TaxID=2867405 RepID=A0A383UHZ3_BLUHO|nr:unnamed protein product [Blumeria hordei]
MSDQKDMTQGPISMPFPPSPSLISPISVLITEPSVNLPAIRLDQPDHEIGSLKPQFMITTSQLPLHSCEPEFQDDRLNQFAFETVSLPISRVTSLEESSRELSRLNSSISSTLSTKQSPQISMHSPPITPVVSRSLGVEEMTTKLALTVKQHDLSSDRAAVTPQVSPPTEYPSTKDLDTPSFVTIRETSTPDSSIPEGSRPSTGVFSIDPNVEELMSSLRATSPPRSTTASTYSKPFTPVGDANDPYAADKRLPQPRNLENLDERFKFTALNSKSRITKSASYTGTPKIARSTLEQNGSEKRTSKNMKGPRLTVNEEELNYRHKNGSMSELKQFFKINGRAKLKQVVSSSMARENGTKTPSNSHKYFQQLPFGDDHGLQSKYGKLGKVLGAGAGGSVRLMKRSRDGRMFAVKEFRARHSHETEREYAKKVTAEFCIGSTLHHGNIIETLDIVCEKGKWYEVMEYAPFDLFAIVMTGKMSRNEINCSFLQILNGVTYLHSMGLAHRDLKLDNVVVNEQGIMKIIDFGNASVFKYPFETGITRASGIVGSDPYLAPEVYDERKYDPQPADIWSLAIIFCCMSLRRFPWKLPRMTDHSFKLFASPPTQGMEVKHLPEGSLPPRSATTPVTKSENIERASVVNPKLIDTLSPCNLSARKNLNFSNKPINEQDKKPEIVKGPWRLLRLLPRETRHIMGRMLEIDPNKRADMSDILEDPWVSGTSICTREANGDVKHAPGHTHTLEPPSPPTGKHRSANHGKSKAKR